MDKLKKSVLTPVLSGIYKEPWIKGHPVPNKIQESQIRVSQRDNTMTQISRSWFRLTSKSTTIFLCTKISVTPNNILKLSSLTPHQLPPHRRKDPRITLHHNHQLPKRPKGMWFKALNNLCILLRCLNKHSLKIFLWKLIIAALLD